ncbi:hypothetical protein [Sulfurospirillum deleyianum]|uniref:Uncharacterized protein n=1 Tax=Sulfurospirillum deleyianum (strain ATCC 51133 / DSM 6946 / 5175) TaxID=525898 RepID=D1B1L4_SULD5|nr:hypothetical protein [Sulfurospirillum deleyianum]ACZ11984.1 hypothetical protein Sdel_0954 [Sulfurospirillum deleyianum DSM 6946]
MITTINPKEFIKAQNDAKEAIIEAHFKGSIEYVEGIPYYDSNKNKDLSPLIEKLIDFNVFDYDEYSYSLLLSDDYNAHLKTYTDVNIKDIEDKQKTIKKLIRDINIKIKDSNDYSSEIKKINSIFRSIKKVIYRAIESLNEKEMKFKAEVNFEVKKANLHDCKADLTALSEAVNNTDKFLLEYKSYFVDELGSDSVSFHMNQLAHHIHDVRENISKTLNELSKYLIHIEKEAKKIEKLNHLYKLKMNGELFEKSNIESVFFRLQDIATSFKVKTQYKNDDELITSIVALAKENDISVNENMQKEEKRPEAVIQSQDKEVKQRVVLSTKKVYKVFIRQDKDLATFLKQKDLDKKQFLSILIRITLQYNKFLTISKDEIIEHKGIKIPYIIKRG